MTLTKGAIALIDAEDIPLVTGWRWHLRGRYASADRRVDGIREQVLMHRLILNAPPCGKSGRGLEVDHVNGDPLDNRRRNLRLVTRSQNIQNRRAPWAGSITGIRGVGPAPWGVGYQARVYVGGKRISLGSFPTVEEAAQAVAEGRRHYMTHAPECDG